MYNTKRQALPPAELKKEAMKFMTQNAINNLKPGDIVRHRVTGDAYTVTARSYTGRVFAHRELQVSNPQEWESVDAEQVREPDVKKAA